MKTKTPMQQTQNKEIKTRKEQEEELRRKL